MIKKIIVIAFGVLAYPAIVLAQPYGFGKYNENVPYGSETSITISNNGNVTIPITPTDSGTLATGSSIITVTSTDVVGYKLYIRANQATTNMINGANVIPASANGTPAPLANNTWGYNTDASSNFVGIALTDALIKNTAGPFTSGDNTTVTYGVKLDTSKPAGYYSATVMYTAAPETD